jgi:hypothetical protein
VVVMMMMIIIIIIISRGVSVDGMLESDQSSDEQLFLLRRGAALSDRLLLQLQVISLHLT